MADELPSNTIPVLQQAFEKLLGLAEAGAVAFARCLDATTVRALAADARFSPNGWTVRAVTDTEDAAIRNLTADRAVEWREDKAAPVLLLVDVETAGAGMDGIYNAAREVGEQELFDECIAQVLNRLPRGTRDFARAARRKARKSARNQSLSPWRELRYLCQGAAGAHRLGEALPEIGLWPIAMDEELNSDDLDKSARLVERLLPQVGNRQSPSSRVSELRLPVEQADVGRRLSRFLTEIEPLSRLDALQRLGGEADFWINRLSPGVFDIQSLDRIEWVPWRGKRNDLLKWSGLIINADGRPELRLNASDDDPKNRAKLEVRWKTIPAQLAKGAVDYLVQVRAGQEVLAEKSVTHQGRPPHEKCLFVQDDFGDLDPSDRFETQVVIRAIAGDGGEAEDSPFRAETEDFILCFGERPASVTKISARTYPTLALALAEVSTTPDQWNDVAGDGASAQFFSRAKNGSIVCRIEGRTGAVFCPNLFLDLAADWGVQQGVPGRWRLRVRPDGSRLGAPEFISLPMGDDAVSKRFLLASQAFWRWLAKASFGPLAVIYGEQKAVVDYVNAATAWWEQAEPTAALTQTVEVLGAAGETLGLIVLPMHPLRVSWQQGFDQLVLHHRYQHGTPTLPAKIKTLLSNQSGAHYPALLPGLPQPSGSSPAFVYADHLGFHAVAMTLENDPEPKATVALLSRLLAHEAPEEEETLAPSIGRSAANLLGGEVASYLRLHNDYSRVKLHALRPGDAKVAARALGIALQQVETRGDDEDPDDESRNVSRTPISFDLDLYPSRGSDNICGRFLSTTAERRRSGAGVVPEQDRWLLNSVRRPGGVMLPRLHWARRAQGLPESPAHLSLAFDLLSSRVQCVEESSVPVAFSAGTLELHGLALSPDRLFESEGIPHWISAVTVAPEGDKHPAGRVLTERLLKAHAQVLRMLVRQQTGGASGWPLLLTEVSPDQEEILTRLHALCDWVVSVDRHAGVEYFDSPESLPRPYEAYLIDCVPERDDLGFLQLITSTSSLGEIRGLLGDALAEMGVSASPNNCVQLLNALKALSGRLALRLTHSGHTVSELVALALLQNRAAAADNASGQWTSLRAGFFVPLDDVPELLQIPGEKVAEEESEGGKRADLLYVTAAPRGGLRFRFVEVKFRRHLKTARSADVSETIESQVNASWERFAKLYGPNAGPLQQSVLRLRLARFLRFYLRKARRHGLAEATSERLSKEIEKLAANPTAYDFADFAMEPEPHCGYVLCPEYRGEDPARLEHAGRSAIWLFGCGRMVEVAAPPAVEPASAAVVPVVQDGSRLISEFEGDQSRPDGTITAQLQPDIPADGTVQIDLGSALGSDESVCWGVSTQGNPHLLVVGLPGMGKTTSLIHICTQLARAGIAPIVFSYHEDIDQKLTAALDEQVNQVSYSGLGFNPLEVVESGPLAFMDNVSMLRDIFAGIFSDLGDVQLGRVREALKRSYQDCGWARGQRGDIPTFRAFYDLLKANPKPDKPLMLRLDELADYGFFEATSGAQSLLDSPKPVLVQIHATQNDLLQRAFASFVLHNIYQAMFRRGVQQRITHAVVFDEAHRASKLKLIPTMAKECRKFGLSLIVASQEVKDFDDSLFTAIASFLALRTSESDAKRMAKVFAPSDKLALFTDRLKQSEKHRGWFHSEARKVPTLVKLASNGLVRTQQ